MDLIEKWILEGIITLRGMRKHDDIALIDWVFFFFFFSLVSNDCLPFHKMKQRFWDMKKDLHTGCLKNWENSAMISGMRHFIGYFCKLINCWYVPRNRTIEIKLDQRAERNSKYEGHDRIIAKMKPQGDSVRRGYVYLRWWKRAHRKK